MYHYPSFRPYASGERHMLLTKNDLDFGKSTGSAQKNMTLFLPAYEVLGDRRWLDAARNTADLLLKAKTSAGIWSSNYLMIEGKRPVPYLPFGDADVLGLEDDIQTHPIMMLIWLWRLTKDMHYRDTAIKGAELLIRAQNANGSWPQYWSLSDGKPRGHGHSVLNDGATTEPMFVLLMMYHATGDERWLAPIPQAVDWIISAQNRQGGIPGWAEQYDADNKPSWGREFEPPAVCPVPTNMAITGLDLAYRLTGNDKYLEPMRTLAGWLKENMRDEWGFYTDPKTAEPIHALNGKVYKGAQSPDIRAGEVVRPGNYYDAAKIEVRIAELEQRALRPQLVNEKAVQQSSLLSYHLNAKGLRNCCHRRR